jgi:transglutaminase-like putative cysteine protease
VNLAARYNAVLHAGLVLAMAAFAAADEKPMLLLLAVLGAGVSWALSRGARAGRPATLPRLAVNGLVLAAIGNAAVAASGASREDPVVSTLGQFLVHVTIIKLFDRRGHRDEAQLVALGVFDAVAAMLTSNALLVGVALLVYTPTAVASSMLLQLVWGQSQAQARSALPGAALPPVEGRGARAGFLRVCAGSVLVSAAIATVVFVFTPRGLGSDFLGQFGMVRERQIGYREDVKLGEAGLLSEDPTPVLDFKIETAEGENVGSAATSFYLRGSARDTYDPKGRTWVDTTGNRRAESVSAFNEWTVPWRRPGATGEPAPSPRALSTRVQTITMRGEVASGAIFCLWRPFSVTPDHNVKLRFTRQTGALRRESDGSGGGTARVTYRIRSSTGDDAGIPLTGEPGFQSGYVHDLALQILRDRKVTDDPAQRTDRQVATAFRNHLREGYQYTTLLTAPPGDQDPIEFFLRDHKEGHCEYFASAMTALCQAAGLRARIVTGYYAAEFNTLTGQYVVRQSNAHAWCEVFIVADRETGAGRWETFDPSPQGDIERIHRPSGGLLARLRSWYEALEFGWSTSVVGFDNLRQSRLMGRTDRDPGEASRGFLRTADRVASWLRGLRGDPRRLPAWVRLAPGTLLVLVLLSILAGPAWRRWGPKWARVRRTPSLRPVRRLADEPPYYQRALRALNRSGVPKPVWSPPATHAAALEGRAPAAATALRALAALYYRARFGGRALTPAEAAAAEGHAEALERSLREAAERRRAR